MLSKLSCENIQNNINFNKYMYHINVFRNTHRKLANASTCNLFEEFTEINILCYILIKKAETIPLDF